MTLPSPWHRLAILLTCTAVLASCRVEGIDLVVDDRIRITSPDDRAEVALPVEVRWAARDLPSGARFAVFVDRAPQPPGEPLAWFAREDETCRPADGCPSAYYFAQRSIYETEAQRHRIVALAPRRDMARGRRDHHEVTVVVLDERGRRVGEAAAFVELRVRPSGPPS